MADGSRLSWRRRWLPVRFAVMVLVVSAGLVGVNSTPSWASDTIPCASLGSRDWVMTSFPLDRTKRWESYDYLWFDSTPTFNVSDTRIAVNDLDAPASATFTSQKSQTWSISASLGMAQKLSEALTRTLGVTIQVSRTTSIGVSVTATVPPRSGIRGDYGVRAFEVDFEARTYERYQHQGFPYFCIDHGIRQHHVNAPTDQEGWRVGPL